MLAYYSDHFVLPLPDGHRFPMAKYALLRERVALLFDKLELQLRQCLRERKLREGKGFVQDEGELANVLLAFCEGKIHQFVRSGFTRVPSQHFANQWQQSLTATLHAVTFVNAKAIVRCCRHAPA